MEQFVSMGVPVHFTYVPCIYHRYGHCYGAWNPGIERKPMFPLANSASSNEDGDGDSMRSREKRLVSKLGESRFIHAVNGASYEPKFALVGGAKWRSKERKRRRE